MSGPAPEGRRPLACPRCGAELGPDQSWCLECGLAARTRLARAPNWRAPLVVAGAVGVAAIVALVVAFFVVTGDNAPLPTTATAATTPPLDTAGPAAATTAVSTAATTTVATTTLPATAAPATTVTVPTAPPTGTTATTP